MSGTLAAPPDFRSGPMARKSARRGRRSTREVSPSTTTTAEFTDGGSRLDGIVETGGRRGMKILTAGIAGRAAS
jgi:hypothetical protein